MLTGGPSWLEERVANAVEAAARLSVPDRKDEAWKYVDLPDELADWPTAAGGASGEPEGVFLEGVTDRAGSVHLVDGRLVDKTLNADKAVLLSIADGLAKDEPALEKSYLAAIPPDRDLFSAQHQAAAPDGVVLRLPAGFVDERPFVLDLEAVATESVSYPHVVIEAEAGSEATVILNARSAVGSRLVVPQISTTVGSGANLTVTRAQHLGPETFELGYHRVLLDRDATVRLGDVGLGGAISRLDLTVDLAGRGSSFEMMGAYFGDRRQIMDYRVIINHRSPNTSSNVFLKGAVEDAAESVFSGLLKIFPDASKVSAFETNRNLVLSEDAKAHSVPNLEILCDDVICGHGSTVGPLEADHIYYLMSRGLPRDRAERLLVRGFFEEIIQAIPAVLAEPTRNAFNAKFVAAQEEGRL